jgi:uroporphyrin-III C-methyltransferase/precorrin-2 dehydrogenase/sirohydrochlorin ferrochelatase
MLVFATGHTREGRLDLDFQALARPDQTVAVYMGLATLAQLVEGLAQEGFDLNTPAALIEQGGSPRQRELRGTLASVAARAQGWCGPGPVLVLLGEVVALGATGGHMVPAAIGSRYEAVS